MAAQLLNRLGQLGVGMAIAGDVANSALFNVDGGHRAVIFDKYAFHHISSGVVRIFRGFTITNKC